MTSKATGGGMPYKADIANFISDWWQFAFFIGGAFIAFIVGKERQRYKVDEIGRVVDRLEAGLKDVRKELSSMHQHEGAEAISSARSITELATDIRYLRKAIDEMRAELKEKADK